MLKVIKSKNMAKFLINIKKIRLEKMDRDIENPAFDVYLFEDTEELRNGMTEFTINKNNKKCINI
jgi:hypothetical protein